jgi:arylsulfatase A-like enzyme
MKKNLSRREFLNISSLLALSSLFYKERDASQTEKPNIVILLFDAWSARNMSLYGYHRDTTPHLTRLAERAIVFHNHYASAPWTIPGTASLLTGTHPWTHRAFTITDNQTTEEYVDKNIFAQFQDEGYYTDGYSHNPYANLFLYQFGKYLDRHTPLKDLFLKSPFFPISLLPQDPDAAALTLKNTYYNNKNIFSSLFLSGLLKPFAEERLGRLTERYENEFPRGIPSLAGPNYFYRLEDSIDFMIHALNTNPKPYLGFYHLYPPHAPYATRKEFINIFDDEKEADPKPDSVFSEGDSATKMFRARHKYDEFIAYVDAEFARLYAELERSGQLSNTWIILTTDHGEMFERGIIGHETPAAYEPVIHIPLIIFPPGQEERSDVHTRTSAVDVLPTLLNISNIPNPLTLEGEILPTFNNPPPNPDRSIFAFHPGHSSSNKPLSEGTAVIIKNGYKLIYSFGFEELQQKDSLLELYDINNDPEEVNDLYSTKKQLADDLFDELVNVMEQADQNYVHEGKTS